MYRPFEKKDGLSQGDVCRDVPIALLGPQAMFGDAAGGPLLQGTPTPELLARRSNLTVAIPLARGPVMILSQSCDLEEVESAGEGRILIAPIVPHDHERFLESFSGSAQQSAEALAKKLVTAVSKRDQTAETIKKGAGTLDRPRQKALEDLWLGKTIGAFPLAASAGPALPASICYLDNVVSVPATWAPLLREQRILALNLDWSAVLREALQQWISRFAYPGSKTDRLRVGGLVDDEQAGQDASPDGSRG